MGTKPREAFRLFRTSVLLAAITTSCLSAFGLILVNVVYPPKIDATSGKQLGGLDPAWFSLFQNVFGTLFSIGVVGILYEWYLRRSYADDLSTYLSLKTAIVTSGLQELAEDRFVDWREFTGRASTIQGQFREPQRWLLRNFEHILDSAKSRPVTATLGVPDPQSSVFAEMARSVGLETTIFEQRIQTTISELESMFDAASPELQSGTSISVVQYAEPIAFEIVLTEDSVAVMLTRSVKATSSDQRLAMVFRQEPNIYPSAWIRPQLDYLSQLKPISYKEKK